MAAKKVNRPMTAFARPSIGGAYGVLARGAFSALFVNVSALGIGFLSQLLLARVLGAEGYGIYAYVFTWATLLALIATLGFQATVLKFAAVYLDQQQWPLLRGIVRYATIRVLSSGLLIAVAGALVVTVAYDRIDPALARTFWIGVAAVPILALLRVRSSLARALGRVASAIAPDTLVRESTILLVAAVALGSGVALGAPQAMLAMVGGTLIGLALITRTVQRASPEGLALASPVQSQPDWMRTALPLLLIAGLQIVLRRTDIIMLGLLSDTAAVGVYAIATRIADLVLLPLTAINIVFSPRIAALFARDDRPGLQAAVTQTSRWIGVIVIPLSLVIFVSAGPILQVFGADFREGATSLRILLAAQCVNALCGSIGSLMTMTGNERAAALVLGGAATLNVVANGLLIPVLGIEGAAIATGFSMVLWNLVLLYVVRRRTGVLAGPFGKVNG